MPSWRGRWEFDLGNLELKEGDVVSYYVTARDNKQPGWNQSRTSTLKFQVEHQTTQERVRERLEQDKELQDQQFRQRPNQQKSKNREPNEQRDENDSGEQQQKMDPADAPDTKVGEQEGAETKALVASTPSLASLSKVGVERRSLTEGFSFEL